MIYKSLYPNGRFVCYLWNLKKIPLHLFVVLLLSGLSLHLLHLDGVGLSPPHVQLMVSHTQSQDALVDAQSRGIKHKVLHDFKKRGAQNPSM